MIKPISLITAALLLMGCATKHYPEALPVSPVQHSTYDCKTINQEIEKYNDMQKKIDKIGEFDGKTAVAFLIDFGLGNGIAKYQATKAVKERLTQLEAMKSAKCMGQATTD